MRLGWKVVGTTLSVAVGVAMGCRAIDTAAVRTETGAQLDSVLDLRPDASLPSRVRLLNAGTPMTVTVKESRAPKRLVFDFLAHGQVVDREVYAPADGQFLLVEGGGETYVPPMDLLRFPMRIGESWEWHGALTNNGDRLPAKARISHRMRTEYVEGASRDAVIVDVELKLAGPRGSTLHRDMTFMFVEGKGLVARRFGEAAARALLEP